MRYARVPAALLGLALCACFKPQPEESAGGPALRITSEHDTALFMFVVNSDFKTLTDDPACKSLTAASSKPMPRSANFSRALASRSPGLPVPLALTGGGPCEWSLLSVWLDERGAACHDLQQISFVGALMDPDGSHPTAPDTLDYLCRPDTATACLRCEEAAGKSSGTFRLDPSRGGSLHFRIRKE